MKVASDVILVYVGVLILAALLSWMPPHNPIGPLNQLHRAVRAITEPVLRPVRKIVPTARMGSLGVDVSVYLVVVVLLLIRSAL